jgi:hypothetical protein
MFIPNSHVADAADLNNWRDQKCIQNINQETLRKKPPENLRLRWENNVKMDRKGI